MCARAVAQAGADAIERAHAQFRFELLMEVAGVFWIAAEIAILFGMTIATRILATRPLLPGISLTSAERRQALLWAAGLGVLVVTVFGRHAFIDPLPSAFTAIAETGINVREKIARAYAIRTHSHVAIWCLFIAAWVGLECAIVAQGIRAYGRLKGLIQDGS